MKILLVCSGGMSTSLIVEKMKAALLPEEKDSVINAISMGNFEENVQDYDVVLLGPQIRYKKDEFADIASEYGVAVDVINPIDYGMVKGDKILNLARELYKNKK